MDARPGATPSGRAGRGLTPHAERMDVSRSHRTGGDVVVQDTPEEIQTHLSHDRPCSHCGHAVHTYLPSSDTCTCRTQAMAHTGTGGGTSAASDAVAACGSVDDCEEFRASAHDLFAREFMQFITGALRWRRSCVGTPPMVSFVPLSFRRGSRPAHLRLLWPDGLVTTTRAADRQRHASAGLFEVLAK